MRIRSSGMFVLLDLRKLKLNGSVVSKEIYFTPVLCEIQLPWIRHDRITKNIWCQCGNLYNSILLRLIYF